MSIKYKKDLTPEQNQALTEFAVQVAAKFKYTSSVNFATVNNQLKFTNRLYAGVSSYPDLSTVSYDKNVQKLVSSMLINLQINNNKVSANASMKLAYLASAWSTSSNRYQKAVSEVAAFIDANANLSISEKGDLKVAANASFSAMASAIFGKQTGDTMKWAKSKLKLSSGLALTNLGNDKSKIDTSAYIALGNTFKAVESNSLSSVTDIAATIEASLGASNVVGGTSSIMASASAALEFSTVFKGTTDSEIDGGYKKAMSSILVDAEATASLDASLDAIVANGSLTADAATTLKKDVTAKFFGSMGIKSNFICEGS